MNETGAIPAALLSSLDLALRRKLHGLLPGEHRAFGRRGGTELAVVRPYVAGDDVRTIDWNVTARTNEPHIREPVAERVLTSWILLDVSPSMTFGTADRRKWDVAEGVAMVLGHLGSRRGNRIGVVAFGGRAPSVVPPRRGRAGLLGVLAAIREQPAAEPVGTTAFDEAFLRTARMAGRGALVAIVSDLRGLRDWDRALGELASRHEVLVVEIRDPREMDLVPVGHLWLVDPETDRQLLVDTTSRRLRERFASAAAEERADVSAAVARTGAGHVVVSTEGDWLAALAAFVRGRRVGKAS